MSSFQVTRHFLGEEPLLWRLYFDTTHLINGRDYTPAQCARWAPLDRDMGEWTARIQARQPFVLRTEAQILGFAELEPNGHIDFFYVHHLWQGKGVGRALYAALEAEAQRLSLTRLFLESSKTAQPFFVNMGFTLDAEEEHFICDAIAQRFLMSKQLRPTL